MQNNSDQNINEGFCGAGEGGSLSLLIFARKGGVSDFVISG